MFDLRYHVASLTAVFVALILGILVGVGISGRGLVDDVERDNFNAQIAELRAQRDAASGALDTLTADQRAADAFVDVSYPAMMDGRLRGRRIALVAIGVLDEASEAAVRRTVGDAGGRVTRTLVLRMPVEEAAVADAVEERERLRRASLEQLAAGLGRELVLGWADVLGTLAPVLVEEQEGDVSGPVDGVVVVRGAPQMQASGRFVKALYATLADARVPAVGVEHAAAEPSAAERFAAAGLSTVEPVDTPAGRLALAALLSGAPGGRYGTAPEAQAVLPPIEPVPPERGG